ncbi:MAG: transporter substrate-binding domain-containing protein [Clostridiales bacterium]|nr:transporter substrate-binding domain-containing protein [Clostridiales bacterium]
MKKNFRNTLAGTGVAAILAVSALSGCSALGSAPTIAAETETEDVAETEAAKDTGADETTEEAAATEAESIAATDGGTRLDDILARGYIEVATEPYFAPNEFIDPSKQGDDKYVGSDIELAYYIADQLGVECHIIPLEFDAVLTGITDGKYDLAISALAYTPARAEAMEMSIGYRFGEITQYGLLIREEDAENIKTAEDLADKVVVCQAGSLQELFATQQIPAMQELKRTSSSNDAYLTVQEGKADAAAVAKDTAQLYVDANPEGKLMVVPDFAFETDESTQGTRIGITKGETALLDKVNEILEDLVASGQYDEWYEEYSEYARSLGL